MSGAVFLDKDGTLVEDVPYNVDPARMRLAPGAPEALRTLSALGLRLFVVSNQAGVALGRFPAEALLGVEARLRDLFAAHGARLAGCYWCPHHPEGAVREYAFACTCRKPMPGMLRSAAAEHGVDLARSWMVGDILDDVEAGNRAGCRTILLDVGHETEWKRGPWRVPTRTVGGLREAAAVIGRESRERAPARIGRSA